MIAPDFSTVAFYGWPRETVQIGENMGKDTRTRFGAP